MTRKMLTAAVAIVAMMMSVFALTADADGHLDAAGCTVSGSGAYATVRCSYPGPITVHPVAATTGAFGFGEQGASIVGAHSGDTGTSVGNVNPMVGDDVKGVSTGGLAHTGSESAVLGYLGAGMIAFGAVAMGSRRKFFQGALED